MAHSSDLNKELGEINDSIEENKSEMEILKIKRESVENIKLIQAPQSSPYPIKPKKILNISLAFVVGLVISIILAFFLEYLQKMRVYSPSQASPHQVNTIKNLKQ